MAKTATRKVPRLPLQRGTVPEDFEVGLRERDHLDGCPEAKTNDRLDYWTTIPKNGPNEGVEVVIERCKTCGGERSRPLAEAMKAQTAKAQASDD